MSKQEKPSTFQKIERKWVKEGNRTFSEFPGVPRTAIPGEEETWLEISHFYRDDLKWLLSLEHHKFWSYMIYSEKTQELLISFLKGFPPNCLKGNFPIKEEVENVLKEIEHLVFLIFLRLSTEKESETCFVKNFGDVIYNYYIFTVPIILDICMIYGASNEKLVKEMIHTIITSAPNFLDDFQEIIPHFFYVLKTVKEKFLIKSGSEGKEELTLDKLEDLVIYISDSVATIQVFLEFYPNFCQLFSKAEVVSEVVSFYSNVLPQMLKVCEPYSFAIDLIQNVRFDLLKIVKSIFDFIVSETDDIPEKKNLMHEYLALVMKLVAEPVFLSDYNLLYSVEFQIEYAVKRYRNVDLTEVHSILQDIASALNSNEDNEDTFKEPLHEDPDMTGVKFNSLVTEVKEILPHLEENFIRRCLNYFNNDTESVIAAVLENRILPDLTESKKEFQKKEEMLEFTGKHKNKHKNLNEMLNDRDEISKMKERYAKLSFVIDDDYDDEYDDTYDENLDVAIREGDDAVRRPFTIPRILRGRDADEDEEEEEEDEDEEEEEESERMRENNFVENPAVLRERIERARQERIKRDVTGRPKGQGQSNQVVKNRNFKESHKSFVANHNRKKQANRKMARGMIPS